MAAQLYPEEALPDGVEAQLSMEVLETAAKLHTFLMPHFSLRSTPVRVQIPACCRDAGGRGRTKPFEFVVGERPNPDLITQDMMSKTDWEANVKACQLINKANRLSVKRKTPAVPSSVHDVPTRKDSRAAAADDAGSVQVRQLRFPLRSSKQSGGIFQLHSVGVLVLFVV